MKKTVVAVLVVGVAIAFALSAFAADVKTSTETKGGTTVEKTEVKTEGLKATEKVTTTEEGTMTEQKLKTKNVKMEREKVETPEGSAGMTKMEAKKGAIKNFNIEWSYFQDGKNYIVEYTLKGKANKELLSELGLTPTQVDLIRPGKHTITSTSPYTFEDVRANFQDVIIKDLASTIKKQ